MRENKFVSKKNWEQIEKQYIFEALLPFVPERPIDFFIPDPNDATKTKGTLSNSTGDFSLAAEQRVVLTLKRRKVVVLSSDENCQDTALRNVMVARIISIKPEQVGQDWYNLLVQDQHPWFAYLPKEVTGQECFVDLTSVTAVGKTMLLSKKYMVPSDRMAIVETVFQNCIDLGVIKSDEAEQAN